MADNLYHYGVPGMHWGRHTAKSTTIIKTKTKVGKEKTADIPEKKTTVKKKTIEKEVQPQSQSHHKQKISEMSDDELKSKIQRLELENKYKGLSITKEEAKSKKGKEFIMDVLEKSGKNISVQLATYAMGTAVNKVAGSDIVNPKKGQKEK